MDNNPGYNYNSNLLFGLYSRTDKSLQIIKSNNILSISESKNIKNHYISTCREKSIKEFSETGTINVNPIIEKYNVEVKTTTKAPVTNSTSTETPKDIETIKNYSYKKIEFKEETLEELNKFVIKDFYSSKESGSYDIQFGNNMLLSCSFISNTSKTSTTNNSNEITYTQITSNEYRDFCNNKPWLNLEIFNLEFLTNGLIGKLANSDNKYLNDWLKIIKDKYTPNSSTYNESSSVCSFPMIVSFVILYDKTGSPEDPVYYILGANLETINVELSYNELINNPNASNASNNNILNLINFKLSIKYVFTSVNNTLKSTRDRPSLFPQLPVDIVNPLID